MRAFRKTIYQYYREHTRKLPWRETHDPYQILISEIMLQQTPVENEPTVFIETNIRAVFIHFFFEDRAGVKDGEIHPLVASTLDRSNPRTWYYALMDYGVMVKRKYRNPGRKSAHHHRQSPFRGSNRQVRGMILRALLNQPEMSRQQLVRELEISRERLERGISGLQKEGLIKEKGRGLTIG